MASDVETLVSKNGNSGPTKQQGWYGGHPEVDASSSFLLWCQTGGMDQLICHLFHAMPIAIMFKLGKNGRGVIPPVHLDKLQGAILILIDQNLDCDIIKMGGAMPL